MGFSFTKLPLLLFADHEDDRSIFTIIKWWEIRRIPYNIIVGFSGLISLFASWYFIYYSGNNGQDAIEPLLLIAVPFLFNIAYTAGWIVELIMRFIFRIRIKKIGPFLLAAGLILSLLLILDPLLFWICIYLKIFKLN